MREYVCPIDEHFTFVQNTEKLVSCSVKVNSRFLSKVTHVNSFFKSKVIQEKLPTIRRPATNQQQQPYVASADPGSQHFTFYFVSKVSLDF